MDEWMDFDSAFIPSDVWSTGVLKVTEMQCNVSTGDSLFTIAATYNL